MRIALLLWLLSGCDVFRCDEGQSRCSADGIAVCNAYGEWEIGLCCLEGCREVDVDGNTEALCSATDDPDPRCDGVGNADVCVDNTRLRCRDGYASAVKDCDQICVAPNPQVAVCALAEIKDLRCPAEGFAERCGGDRIVFCAHGFAVGETLCEAPFGTCILAPDNLGGGVPTCATALPDAACPIDGPGRCDGDDIFGCRGGRRTFSHCQFGCYENPIDSMFPEAFCNSAPCSIE